MRMKEGWIGRLAATGLAGIVLAVGGCGDDEPTNGSSATGRDRADQLGTLEDPPVTTADDRVHVAEVVRDVQEGFMATSPDQVCFELSDAASRRLLGGSGRPPRSCEEAVEAALKRWHAAGEEPIMSKVQGVEVEGDEAFVTLDVPEVGHRWVRVIRADRGWDLPVLRLDHPPGFELLSDPGTATDNDERTVTDVYLPPRLEESGRTGERAAAAEVVLDVQEGLVIRSGLSVCIELTRAAERRVMHAGRGAPRPCPTVVEEAVDRWRAAGEDPVVSKVGRVKVDGREAAVTVGNPDGGRYRVRVVKGRDWRLPDIDLDHPPGLISIR